MKSENPPKWLQVAAAGALVAWLAVGCSARREPAAVRPTQQDLTATTKPTPADDYIAAELGHMAVEDQERCATSVKGPTKPPHRDSPMRSRPRRPYGPR